MVSSFGGIDRTSPIGDGSVAENIRNFRILPDGSLEKRCGYYRALDLPQKVRALWSGELEGAPSLVVLAGDTVYLTDPEEAASTPIGGVGTQSGTACFFLLEDRLYLIDGGDVYRCTRAGVWPVSGYVPLYGRDWLHSGGEINEPLNQLSRYIRITYKLTTTSTANISTGIAAEAVESLIINGVPKTSGYSLIGTTLNLGSTASMGSVIEVCLDIGTSYTLRSTLASSVGAAVYGGKYDTSVFCFGGLDKSRVFRSKYVSGPDVEASRAVIPDSGALYFPVGYDFLVAAGGAEVTSVCRHYDRLLLFTADDARMTDLSENSYQDTPVRPINSGVGCLGGVVLCDNDPVTVSRGGIYRWTDNTDQRDESSAVDISAPLCDLIDFDFRSNSVIHNFREKNEIWIGNPTDPGGRVFVYNWRINKWYCFTQIPGEIYFTYGDKAGFSAASGIYLFGENEYLDDGCEIVADYTSGYSDMSLPGSRKRVKRIRMTATGSGISVSLRDPSGNRAEISFGELTKSHFSTQDQIGCHEARVSTGRLDYVGYRISARGEGRQRIFGLALTASK